MALRTPLSVTPHLYMGDSTGRPLDKGVVYFGEQDKDPEFYPINLFSDDALTKPLAQPVHTKGGYLYDKGDMVEPHAKELIYSVKVLDSYGRKVFYKGAMMRNSWNDDVIEQINKAIIGSADVARRVATDITNDAINNTAIEGGVLADTFVVVDGSLSQRTINKGLESIADLSTIKNPKNGLRVYIKSYHAGLGKGGGYFVYDSTKAKINDGGLVINGWVRDFSGNQTITAYDFGARGDGATDDRASIQQAIETLNSNGGGELFFPKGTYLLNSRTSLSGDGYHPLSILVPRSNVSYRGVRGNTTLKVGTGLIQQDTQNFYLFMTGDLPTVENISFRDIIFDGNGGTIPARAEGDDQRCIHMSRFDNLYIGYCVFKNWGGRQVLSLGKNYEKSGRNVVIEHNTVEKVAKDNVGNPQHDHSSFYVTSENVLIAYNNFNGLDNASNKTAIESHSSNAMIIGNRIINFNIGILIAATVKVVRNVVVTNNTVISMSPISIWAFGRTNGVDVVDLRIHNNHLRQYRTLNTVAVIECLHPSSKSATGPIYITNNIIEGADEQYRQTQQNWGVSLTYVDELHISDNIFKNLFGPVLKILANSAFYEVKNTEPQASVNFNLSNNTVVDCCISTTTGYRNLIDCVTTRAVTLNNLRIEGNKFKGGNALGCLFVATDTNKIVFKDNEFEVPTLTKEIDCQDMPVSKTDIKQNSYLSRKTRPNILGSIGCVYTDVVNSIVFEPKSGTPSNRWFATIHSNSAPATGFYLVGDKVINTEPSETAPYGWVCVKSGNPATWKPITLGLATQV